MMRVFGSRSEYLAADEIEIEAQIIVWQQENRARAELNKTPPSK